MLAVDPCNTRSGAGGVYVAFIEFVAFHPFALSFNDSQAIYLYGVPELEVPPTPPGPKEPGKSVSGL